MFAPATITPLTKSSTCSWVSWVLVSVEAIVIVSVEASVVIVIFEPAAKLRVSVVLSGTISDWPDTATVWK